VDHLGRGEQAVERRFAADRVRDLVAELRRVLAQGLRDRRAVGLEVEQRDDLLDESLGRRDRVERPGGAELHDAALEVELDLQVGVGEERPLVRDDELLIGSRQRRERDEAEPVVDRVVDPGDLGRAREVDRLGRGPDRRVRDRVVAADPVRLGARAVVLERVRDQRADDLEISGHRSPPYGRKASHHPRAAQALRSALGARPLRHSRGAAVDHRR
jgi:hypothetical protein